jgi:hypothetical protein
MLAVILLMSIVLFVAVDFYLDLSRASNAATDMTRNARRAVLLLDRVARDLEGSVMLVKPDDEDPLAWPWLFLADARDPDAGADRFKFVRRGHRPRGSEAAESDLEVVAYVAVEGEQGDVELRRWSASQLPESLDRSFPGPDESDLVSGGLASFGVRFEDPEGNWTGRWDSSGLVATDELPIAAEIEVSFLTDVEDVVDGPYQRRVVLPLRPLDLQAELEEAAGQAGEEEVVVNDEDGDGDIDEDDRVIAEERAAQEGAGGDEDAGDVVTVEECLARNPQLAALVNANPQAAALVNGSLGQPASLFEAIVANVLPSGLPENCR